MISNFVDLIQFRIICQMLAKSETPHLSLEKEKVNFLYCVHLLRKAGAWN